MTIRYMTSTEVAAHIGVKPSTLNRYKLPEPDAMIGNVRGWRRETVDAWNAARPGRGRWRATAPTPSTNRAAEIISQALGVRVVETVADPCPTCGLPLSRDRLRPANIVRCDNGHTFRKAAK